MKINDATIHSSNVYNDILNDLKKVSNDAEMILLYHNMMLIFNKISNDNDDEKIYNLPQEPMNKELAIIIGKSETQLTHKRKEFREQVGYLFNSSQE